MAKGFCNQDAATSSKAFGNLVVGFLLIDTGSVLAYAFVTKQCRESRRTIIKLPVDVGAEGALFVLCTTIIEVFTAWKSDHGALLGGIIFNFSKYDDNLAVANDGSELAITLRDLAQVEGSLS